MCLALPNPSKRLSKRRWTPLSPPFARDILIYSPTTLLQEISAGRIIKNLSDRELHNPEGVGFDLCLASLSQLEQGSGSLRLSTRRTPSSVQLEPVDNCFLLLPGHVYLATTVEEFSLPPSLAATFYPRSTLFRSGVSFHSSVLPPGYVGHMTFGLINNHSSPFQIELGSRFAHVVFQPVSGGVDGYRGQWQGGRVSQPEDEDQI